MKPAAPIPTPAQFRNRLVIEQSGKPVRLASVIDDWQAIDFENLDGGWQTVAGMPSTGPVHLRGFLERGRGHSKTCDTAIMVAWSMFAAQRPIRGVWCAADKEQGQLAIDALATLCRLNPVLARVLDVQRTSVSNRQTGSVLTVISSDADSSYGLLPDFVVCDELVHWTDESGERLFHSLLSSAAKKTNCMLLIITNAGRGLGESWQWNVREAAHADPAWYFARLDGPVASWITPALLDEQQRFLPPKVFSRLWGNEWTGTAGDALDEQIIRAAVNLRGPIMARPDGNWHFLAGLDIGVLHDRAALVLVGVKQGEPHIVLARCQSWTPPVDLTDVERTIRRWHQTYRISRLVADPYEARLLLQSLRRFGIVSDEMTFSPTNLHLMAQTILETFNSGAISLYDDAQLLRDLKRINIVERPFGWKIEAPKDRTGHCDSAMALAVVLPAAVRLTHTKATRPTAPQPIARTFDGNRFGILVDRHAGMPVHSSHGVQLNRGYSPGAF